MELDKILFLILDVIDMSQAISIGIFLLIMNKRKKNALLFLSFFLVASGMASLSDIFDFFNGLIKEPYLNFLSLNFFWLLPVLLYLYVEKISIDTIKKPSYFLIIPGALDFTLNIGKFMLPLDLKHTIENSVTYVLFELTGFLFGLVIIILIFRKIKKHSILIKNQYSSLKHRELKWLKVAIVSIMILFGIYGSTGILLSNFVADLSASILGLFITYWILTNVKLSYLKLST